MSHHDHRDNHHYGHCITEIGYKLLNKKLKMLKEMINPATERITRANELGDRSENFEYHVAKKYKKALDAEIMKYNSIFSSLKITSPNDDIDIVTFGVKVELSKNNSPNHIRYIIVSHHEFEISKGSISITSPLIQVMLGKKVGYKFTLADNKYKIINISKPTLDEYEAAISVDMNFVVV